MASKLPLNAPWPSRSALALRAASLCALLGCGTTPLEAGDDPACEIPLQVTGSFAIEDVIVLSFSDGVALPGRTVVVEDGRITSVSPTSSAVVPAGATRLPGCGRTLVPGLADMHVHLSRADLDTYLARGVTTVRNLWGFPDLLAMRDEIEAGSLSGPTIYAISSGLDGVPEKWPVTQLVLTPEAATGVVDAQLAQGYSTLKLYQDLTPEPFEAIVEIAKSRGVDFGGHVPHRVGLRRALEAGYRFVEHLSGFEPILNSTGQRGAFGWRSIDRGAVAELVHLTVAAGAWNSPTLEIFSQIAGGDPSVVANRRFVVKALFDAGAPLLVGTDSGIDVTQPGIALHQELQQFIAAGLTPLEVLRIATVDAARFLGAEDEFGRVEVGLRADLVLVDGDPLADIEILSRPDAVFARGRRVH